MSTFLSSVTSICFVVHLFSFGMVPCSWGLTSFSIIKKNPLVLPTWLFPIVGFRNLSCTYSLSLSLSPFFNPGPCKGLCNLQRLSQLYASSHNVSYIDIGSPRSLGCQAFRWYQEAIYHSCNIPTLQPIQPAWVSDLLPPPKKNCRVSKLQMAQTISVINITNWKRNLCAKCQGTTPIFWE